MIAMIAAFSDGRVLGKNGKMPWHLPAELQYFKRVTSGHPVLMGRKTFESIGRPLPNRRNIVLTRNESFTAEGVEVFHHIEDVKPLMKEQEEFFVIGGATLYETLLDKADRLYITKIHASFEGDTFFPKFDEAEWKEVSRQKGTVDEKNPLAHTFHVYERLK
ncbi:dihydrofolate reductase [Salipaludibacillus agaradhaerens]|uniref:dihydrofolate reductase n=1 Tax=Salipaludibacillus agaradhaerens TaxID=76935 RepID=UPI00215155CB|nr:dihydrofolate reductase [Salipaludibacillus agaradhaerens]MCR6107851.1 dihydrofolate reductase [Salipaludibacillus agaradhaerens]MCR6119880.1 dihydrofolate reductase [Salipaludibacillus agaradhaerens]UJW58926.1 dihydrofolate reductase [Bacillus sp. A116_S68]